MSRAILVWIGLLTVLPETGYSAERDHIVFPTIRRGDTEVLASLLRQGMPPDIRSSDGATALMHAASRGNAASVELLLERGADPNATNGRGATALMWCAGDLRKVRLLLQAGADPGARSALGNTPLIVASAYPVSTEVVNLLLEHGADPNARNRRGYTPLRNAVTAGDLGTVKLLLIRGAVLDDDKDEISEVSIAAGRGFDEIVALLLKRGADPNSGAGRHALEGALLAQQPKIARQLIEHGARLDRRLSPGKVPSILLSAYTEIADTSVARLMIEKGVDLHARNTHDETVLTWARKRGHSELVDLLIQAGSAEEPPKKQKRIPDRDIEFGAEASRPILDAAIQRSISLLQHSSDVFLEKRESCVSCHHQNLPSIPIGWARDREMRVDEPSIERMIEGQLRSWRPRIDRAYEMDRPVPVEPRFIGYGLLGFAALGVAPDEVTDAMVWYLANIQQPDGHWVPGMLRPPLGGGEIVATVLAMRSLQLYPLEGREAKTAEQVGRAASWLRAATPRTHQERVYKLLGLGWAGAPSTELVDAIAELLDEQREDGGWAQLPGLSSDAWATGQSLVALRIAGDLPTDYPACRRAVTFLLKTRFEDGSWYVGHRTWPFQTHFDSEFPHGRDQWVSAPATAWATMALILARDPGREWAETPPADTVAGTPTAETAAVADLAERAPTNQEAIDFVRDIKPILERSCVDCHGGEDPKGGLRLTTRQLLLEGGESGDAVLVPGREREGLLIPFVSDKVEDFEMPPLGKRDKYPALTQGEIGRLRAWIAAGADWPKDVALE